MSITPVTFQQFIERQKKANSHGALKLVCDDFCEAVGFEFYIFAVCSVESFSAPEISTVTNYPDEWLKSYFNDKLHKYDPVVRYCFDHISPVRWTQLLEMDEYLSPEGEFVLKRAGEYGLKHGISFPVKTHSGDIVIYSLATRDGQDIEQRYSHLLPMAQSFAIEFFMNMSRINVGCQFSGKEKLTAREQECIFWACEGKTTWEISKIIDVTERTVVFHLTSVTKKLGAVNRQHAVAKAIKSGLIKPIF